MIAGSTAGMPGLTLGLIGGLSLGGALIVDKESIILTMQPLITRLPTRDMDILRKSACVFLAY